MDATKIVQTLELELEMLKSRFGVKSLGLFGSIARGDASADSDVDILVEFDAPSFDHYIELKLKGSLKPALRDRILREVRNVA